jgi:hypothetical protein
MGGEWGAVRGGLGVVGGVFGGGWVLVVTGCGTRLQLLGMHHFNGCSMHCGWLWL